MAGTRDHGPGAVRVREGTRILNERADAADTGSLTIENTGDRPVQIGSHFHLPDVNAALAFDRARAEGFRLDIPAGTSIRFEPGASRTVPIVRLGGRARVPGLRIRSAGGSDTAGHPGSEPDTAGSDSTPSDSTPSDPTPSDPTPSDPTPPDPGAGRL